MEKSCPQNGLHRDSAWHTSTSLLARLKESPANPSWSVFYRRYAPLVLSFARRKGCDPQQAEDVLQETMLRLVRALPGFRYDRQRGGFRAYLLKVVQNVIWSDLAKASRKRTAEAEVHRSVSLPSAKIEKEWERAWQANLVAEAMDRVRTRITQTTYESFLLYAVEGRSALAVARQLGIDRNAVYQHRNRTIRLLRDEVERIACDREWEGRY